MKGIAIKITTLSLILLLGVSCQSTYTREKIKEEIRSLAEKEYGLMLHVEEVGDTVVARYFVDALFAEFSAEDAKIWADMDNMLLVLRRVCLSMDHPPEFYVAELIDRDNLRIRFSFTRYVKDIQKAYAGVISVEMFRDSLLIEFIVGKERRVFDVQEMDLARFLIWAMAESGDEGVDDYVIPTQEINPPEFLAKIAANRAKRMLRERDDVEKSYVLRNVEGKFDSELKDYNFILDFVLKPGGRPSARFIEEKILPFVVLKVREMVRGYKFQDFSSITVSTKKLGLVLTVPKEG